jgi:fimbrial chaperone protein
MMTIRSRARLALLCFGAGLAPVAALAAAFGVTPIRIDLDPGSRTGIVTVSNDDQRRLTFQVKLAEWTQSGGGEDRHADSADLVFFPQILSVEPGEKRLVRVGLKGPLPARERAYRLFIEELPDAAEKGAGGGSAQIAVRMRFGVPIFVSDGKGEARPEFAAVKQGKGRLDVELRNDGVRQARFEELVLMSGEKVVARANGWYVFPGATKAFAIPVERSACPLAGTLELRAAYAGRDIRKTVEATPALCAP